MKKPLTQVEYGLRFSCNYSRDIFCAAGLDISPTLLAKWRSWCRQFRASVRRCKNEMVATKATSTESAACHITTAPALPALATPNNFLLQDADVGLGLVMLAKAPPTRRANVFPFLRSCLWALSVFQKIAFRWRIDRIETALPSSLLPSHGSWIAAPACSPVITFRVPYVMSALSV